MIIEGLNEKESRIFIESLKNALIQKFENDYNSIQESGYRHFIQTPPLLVNNNMSMEKLGTETATTLFNSLNL
ncbi:MAG: hypothetical protein ACOYPR_09675 [Saprospiraceae bacterium]